MYPLQRHLGQAVAVLKGVGLPQASCLDSGEDCWEAGEKTLPFKADATSTSTRVSSPTKHNQIL